MSRYIDGKTGKEVTLHTGMGVLFAARGVIGRLIALFQAKFRALWNTVRSHAGILVAEKWIKHHFDRGYLNVRPQHRHLLIDEHDPERWWVFEALGSGLWFTPLDEHLKNGERLLIREVPQSIPAEVGWKTTLAGFCARVSGVWEYSWSLLFANARYEVFGAPSVDDPGLMALSDYELMKRIIRFMCSQIFSFLIRRFRGKASDPCPGLADKATGPDDLAAGPPKCILGTVAEELNMEA